MSYGKSRFVADSDKDLEKAKEDAELVAQQARDPKTKKEAEKVADVAEDNLEELKSQGKAKSGPGEDKDGDKDKDKDKLPLVTLDNERTKQIVQITGIRVEDGKVVKVKTWGGDIIDVDSDKKGQITVKKMIEDGVPVVCGDDDGNLTRIGPRNTGIWTLPDDSKENNLSRLHRF